MELLIILVAWPFLLLACGIVFIGFSDTLFGGIGSSSDDYAFMMVLFMLGVILAAAIMYGEQSKAKKESPESAKAKLLKMKGDVYMFSIALLFPMFIRYVVDAFGKNVYAAIMGIIVSFVSIFVGMGIKNNRVLSYASIAGGTLAMIYLYSILWDLGEGARIIAAAFGLVVAVAVAVIKFKDKLK